MMNCKHCKYFYCSFAGRRLLSAIQPCCGVDVQSWCTCFVPQRRISVVTQWMNGNFTVLHICLMSCMLSHRLRCQHIPA